MGLALLAAGAAAGAGAEEIAKLRAYYFGNSFTGNTMPGLHPLLGAGAGKEWSVQANIQAGIPIWVHMKNILDRNPNGERFLKAAPETDAIVMLVFGGHGLSYTTQEMWGSRFAQPTDIGDVNACSYIIEEYLKLNPRGRACVYTAWPGIPEAGEFRKRVQAETQQSLLNQGMEREEVLKKVKERKLTHEEMEPLRRGFDYASLWLTDDYIPESAPAERRTRLSAYATALRAKPAAGAGTPSTVAALAAAAQAPEAQVKEDLAAIRIDEKVLADPAAAAERIGCYIHGWHNTHSRAHMYAVMEALKERFPALWNEGRLGMVPVGDVFLELDRKMKAGEVPGIVNIGEFSADGGHLRSGLPRYTLAATHFAVLFREHPGKADWKVFQERSNYDSGKYGYYVHQPDLAVHLDITPERAKVVNDTIWAVVSGHPYTRVK
jgi:hypothetical protein